MDLPEGFHVNVKIEKASIADAEEILRIQKIAFESEGRLYNNLKIAPLVETLQDVIRDFDTHLVLKAVGERGEIAGSVRASVNEGICWISRLSVSPLYQNLGIGFRLMSEIEKCFPYVSKFELGAGNKSARSIGLYMKLGYVILGEIKKDNVILLRMGKDTAKGGK